MMCSENADWLRQLLLSLVIEVLQIVIISPALGAGVWRPKTIIIILSIFICLVSYVTKINKHTVVTEAPKKYTRCLCGSKFAPEGQFRLQLASFLRTSRRD